MAEGVVVRKCVSLVNAEAAGRRIARELAHRHSSFRQYELAAQLQLRADLANWSDVEAPTGALWGVFAGLASLGALGTFGVALTAFWSGGGGNFASVSGLVIVGVLALLLSGGLSLVAILRRDAGGGIRAVARDRAFRAGMAAVAFEDSRLRAEEYRRAGETDAARSHQVQAGSPQPEVGDPALGVSRGVVGVGLPVVGRVTLVDVDAGTADEHVAVARAGDLSDRAKVVACSPAVPDVIGAGPVAVLADEPTGSDRDGRPGDLAPGVKLSALTGVDVGFVVAGLLDLVGTRAACELAAAVGDTCAMVDLGILLSEYVVPRELDAAADWFVRAAAAGNTGAMVWLGNVLAFDFEQVDLVGARAAYEQGAAAGNVEAMVNLGYLLAEEVDPPDLIGAGVAYEQAGRGGYSDAFFRLGHLLADRVEPQDLGGAMSAYESGAAAGNADCIVVLGDIVGECWVPLGESEVQIVPTPGASTSDRFARFFVRGNAQESVKDRAPGRRPEADPWSYGVPVRHPRADAHPPVAKFEHAPTHDVRVLRPAGARSVREVGSLPLVADVVRAVVVQAAEAPAQLRGANGIFHVRYFLDPAGQTADSSNGREAWLQARRTGVTATDARKLVKLNGWPSAQRVRLLEKKLSGEEDGFFPAYQHGIDREPVIAEWVARNFGISHNSLLCIGVNPRHLATPDGIGDGVICEIKTSIHPLAQAIRTYRDQLQWQLHVTNSDCSLFVVENTYSEEIEHVWVRRDAARIAMLARHADLFLEELDEALAELESDSMPDEFDASLLALPAAACVTVSTPAVALVPSLPVKLCGSLEVPSSPDRQPVREWSGAERLALLGAYSSGSSLLAMAGQFATTTQLVVVELAHQTLNVEGELADRSAARFGCSWEPQEFEKLSLNYFDGVGIRGLAQDMQRDQLGLAFKLFELHLPKISRDVIVSLEGM
ncbi:MAG: YqaJ viral recombinase family protein [Cellulomonas sp.]